MKIQESIPVPNPNGDLNEIEPYDPSSRDFKSFFKGSQTIIHRYRTTFNDISSLRRTVNFPMYAFWMGKLRELSAIPVAAELIPALSTGTVGLVTNQSQIRIVGEVRALDLIEGRIWGGKRYGNFGSTMDIIYEWLKIFPNGDFERIATAVLTATWVAIEGHGAVTVTPYPDYYGRLMKEMVPDGIETAPLYEFSNLHEPSFVFEPSDPIYLAAPGPRVRPILHEEIFKTTLTEANVVGNVYFANYYLWQEKTRDILLYSICPEIFIGSDGKGELVCINAQVKHLREAMPFDKISVTVAIKSLYKNFIKLYFEYFRIEQDGQRTKLAVGEHEAAWVAGKQYKERNEFISFPNNLLKALGKKRRESS